MSETQDVVEQHKDTGAKDTSENTEKHDADTTETLLNDAQVQALIEKAVQKRLAREKTKHDHELQELKTETETIKNNLNAAKQEIETYKQAKSVEGWKQAAAREHNVPVEAIKGSTEEEINQHAEILSELFTQKAYVPTDGQRPEKTRQQAHNRRFLNFSTTYIFRFLGEYHGNR